MEKLIFHIDVNSAFLSWEAAYRLHHLNGTVDLREMDAVVGGDMESRRGIILAKSLSAKRYGIRTGESIPEARQKCPHLLIVPPHYQLYDKCSQAFITLLQEYSPDVEQYSIDEAFVDMTGTDHLWGDPVTAANVIRERIDRELGFTVNIGVSVNKLLAKMGSELKKPNRVHTLFPEEIPAKMWPLEVSELFFVGRATTKKLHTLGIQTIGELAHADVSMLRNHLKSHGQTIWDYANGRDFSVVESVAPKNKGYGNSTNIAFDVTDADTASLVLLSLAESVGLRLRKDGVKSEVIAIGIKSYDLQYSSHQKTLSSSTNITAEIHRTAMELFHELWDRRTPIRHLALHAGRLKDRSDLRQLCLFDMPDFPSPESPRPDYEKLEKADGMVDLIRQRYGIDSLKRAAFLKDSRIDHISGGISREKHSVDYSLLQIE